MHLYALTDDTIDLSPEDLLAHLQAVNAERKQGEATRHWLREIAAGRRLPEPASLRNL